jgi:hypothetical protein
MPARRPPTPPAPVPRASRSSTARPRGAAAPTPRAPPRTRSTREPDGGSSRGASPTDREVGRVARAERHVHRPRDAHDLSISGRRTMPPGCPGTRRRRPWIGAAAVCRGAGAALKRGCRENHSVCRCINVPWDTTMRNGFRQWIWWVCARMSGDEHRLSPTFGSSPICATLPDSLKREREPEGLLLAGQGLSSRAKRASRGRSAARSCIRRKAAAAH